MEMDKSYDTRIKKSLGWAARTLNPLCRAVSLSINLSIPILHQFIGDFPENPATKTFAFGAAHELLQKNEADAVIKWTEGVANR